MLLLLFSYFLKIIYSVSFCAKPACSLWFCKFLFYSLKFYFMLSSPVISVSKFLSAYFVIRALAVSSASFYRDTGIVTAQARSIGYFTALRTMRQFCKPGHLP